MNSSIQIDRVVNGNRSKRRQRAPLTRRPRSEYVSPEPETTELVHAESRVEALRLLVLAFLREVDSLKKAVSTGPVKAREVVDLEGEVEAYEASLIREALIRTNGNQRDASKVLGVKPSTLNAKMKRLGITVETTVTSVD
jgi:DNA-binding NtrC family response regulator